MRCRGFDMIFFHPLSGEKGELANYRKWRILMRQLVGLGTLLAAPGLMLIVIGLYNAGMDILFGPAPGFTRARAALVEGACTLIGAILFYSSLLV